MGIFLIQISKISIKFQFFRVNFYFLVLIEKNKIK